MNVEPEALGRLAGQMVAARDGVTRAEEFARFPAPQAVARDDGTESGTGVGLDLDLDRRRAAGLPELEDMLDVFHKLREGGRALKTTWGGAGRSLGHVDAAQKGLDRLVRRDRGRSGEVV